MWPVKAMFLRVNLPTAELELFDNVTDLLKPMSITLFFALIVGNHLHFTKHHTRINGQKKRKKKTFIFTFRFSALTLLCQWKWLLLRGRWLSQTEELHLPQ